MAAASPALSRRRDAGRRVSPVSVVFRSVALCGGANDVAGLVGFGRHLAFGADVDAGLLALLLGDRRGCAGERVIAGRGLREGDDVADGVPAGQEHDDPVPPERDPAVWRRAVLERLQQEAELLLGLLPAQA